MKTSFKKVVALLLCLTMLVAMVPTMAFAEVEYDQADDDYYKVISKDDYELAPGIVESEIVLNNAEGTHRQVAHVVEVDLNNEYTKVIPSYKGMIPTAGSYGIQVMSEQAAWAEANGYGNVVAAMNLSLSWYDSAYYAEHPELVGEPLGYMVLDGEVYMNSRGQSSGAQTCVVINFDEKDGEARPSDMPKVEIRSTSSAITGWEEQVIPANFGFLVKDGVNQYSVDNNAANGASRSFVGIKADGTFVMVMNDGRQAPYSTGFTNYEMAEFMLSLGCVAAVNGDGGGSSAFLSQRPGEELKINCQPSDGSERPTTHGILVITTAPSDGTFVRAHVSAEDDYYTPGSSVQFTAVGSDLVGSVAEIPEEAAWQLSDPSLGTIDENGLFVSNGTVGEVTVQLVYNGEVVGEDTVNVVVPESLAFVQTNITAPYSKTVTLDIVAKYGYNEVVLKDGDVVYEMSDANMGTLEGNVFTATSDESVTAGVVTATLTHNTDISAIANISFGKASEIAYDFESGADSISNIYLTYKTPYTPDAYNFSDTLAVVSEAEGGKVKNGEYALQVTCDGDSITCMNWCQTRINGWGLDLTDAVSLSFWMYIPEGSHGYEWDFGNAIPVNLGHEFMYGTGWQYFTVNVSDIGSNVTSLDQIRLYHSDTSCAATNYDHAEHPNYYGDVVYYIDDITINYSSAVEDFDPPVISNVLLSHDNTDSGLAMDDLVVAENVVTITAKAADSMEKSNYTGLDASSLVMYVDGIKIDATCNDSGFISTGDVELANGTHIFRIEISDNRGNTTYVEKSVVIASEGNAKNTVKYAPADATLTNLLADSVFWMNLTATAIDKVDTVEMIIDLDNNSTWILDQMIVASGFEATYTVDNESNDATVTFTRVGKVTAAGEALLATIPVRIWTPHFAEVNEDSTSYRLMALETYIQMGLLTETDGNTSVFGSEKYSVVTEFNGTRLNDGKMANGYHSHTSEALADQEATCTADGYTGRTYCAECDSVVEWGTSVPATGHTYAVVGDELVCDCGDVYVGSGLVTMGDNTYYMASNKLTSGWVSLGNEWYYFDAATYAAVATYNNGYVTFEFDSNGKLLSGEWYHGSKGSRYYYGPAYYSGRNGAARWYEIDGKTYCFGYDGYCYTGIRFVDDSAQAVYTWYDFGTDGALVGEWNYTGLHAYDGNLYYVKDGVSAHGMYCVDGAYYYFGSANYFRALTDVTYNCTDNHGLLPAGNYTFGPDGTMIDNEAYTVDGILYHFVLGNISANAGSVEINGATYEVDATGKVLYTGLYTDANGIEQNYVDGVVTKVVKNGIVGDYYYIDDVRVGSYYGLVEFEGNFYYVDAYAKIIKNATKYVNTTNGLTFADGTAVPRTYFEFDAEGKMIIKNGIIGDYYYINGSKAAPYYGLVEFEGSFYYVNAGGKIIKGANKFVNTTNGLKFADGSDVPRAYFEFDADGKMIIKNGIIDDYYYINGTKADPYYGLVKFEGNFYYVNAGGKIIKGENKFVNTTNGLTFEDGTAVPRANFEFDADGKMIIKNGLIDDYYYINGSKVGPYYGLVEFEGNFYYVNAGGKIIKDARKFVNTTNDLTFADGTPVPRDYFYFDAEGKMIIE